MKADITHHRFDDGVHAFDYTLHLKHRLKHRYIRIRNGHPIITANRRTDLKTLQSFVAEHAQWIVRQLAKTATQPRDLTQPDTTLMWRGEVYPILIDRGQKNTLVFEHSHANFTLQSSPDHTTMLSLLQQHYKAHAPSHILPRVEHWSRIMGLFPTKVSFRRARTRWGSCSSRNTLSLNTHLMMLPDALIDYVIVHELAHIQHKNHSRDFWNLVARYLSDHKEHRKRLRDFEAFL